MANRDSNHIIRTLLKSGIILSIIGLVTFVVIFYIVGNKFDQTLKEETDSVTSLITSAVEATDQAADTYERLVDFRMYYVSKAIAKQLHGRKLTSITSYELAKIKDDWALSDISLFVRKGDDIVVAKSSDRKEIGLRSRTWGYWYIAFQQLFDLRQVEVSEGFSMGHFWAGPLIKSVLYSQQFLYAYYYDGTTDFIINPYISAEDVQSFIDSYGPNQLIDNIIKDSSHIAGIEVLNVEPFLNSDHSKVVEPKKDLPVLYGKRSFPLPEDKSVLLGRKATAVQFNIQGKKYKKIYVPLEKQRVLTIVMDVSKRDQSLYHILEMMAIVYLAAFGILYVIVRWTSAKSLHLLEKIRKLAYYDTLTGLANRNHFQEYLKNLLEGKQEPRFALFMIDLDNFKNINDTLGHAAGDRFLINASNRLTKQLDGNGFLARIGGDEFTLIFPIESRYDAEEAANGLLSCFREPFELDGQQFFVTMSIGISLYPLHGEDMDSLLKCADTALYCEKYKSKNNYSIFGLNL